MKVAYLENGIVTNIIMADLEDAHPAGVTVVEVADVDCGIGWSYAGGVASPPSPPPPTDTDLAAAVQSPLDVAARSRGYDDIKPAVTYADEPAVPAYQADGQALRAWRSLVWAAYYSILDAVKSGARTAPTAADLTADLPALTTPDQTA